MCVENNSFSKGEDTMEKIISDVRQYIMTPSNWHKTQKKEYEIYACKVLPGVRVTNQLYPDRVLVTDAEHCYITAGLDADFNILTEREMNEYQTPTGENLSNGFIRSKSRPDGIMPWTKLKSKSGYGGTLWAIHMPTSQVRQFQFGNTMINAEFGNKRAVSGNSADTGLLGHGAGDFIVAPDAGGQPDLNRAFVVNGREFISRYSLTTFASLDLGKYVRDKVPTPPDSIWQSCIPNKNPNQTQAEEPVPVPVKEAVDSGKDSRVTPKIESQRAAIKKMVAALTTLPKARGGFGDVIPMKVNYTEDNEEIDNGTILRVDFMIRNSAIVPFMNFMSNSTFTCCVQGQASDGTELFEEYSNKISPNNLKEAMEFIYYLM